MFFFFFFFFRLGSELKNTFVSVWDQKCFTWALDSKIFLDSSTQTKKKKKSFYIPTNPNKALTKSLLLFSAGCFQLVDCSLSVKVQVCHGNETKMFRNQETVLSKQKIFFRFLDPVKNTFFRFLDPNKKKTFFIFLFETKKIFFRFLDPTKKNILKCNQV